jgi:hypothetical protein
MIKYFAIILILLPTFCFSESGGGDEGKNPEKEATIESVKQTIDQTSVMSSEIEGKLAKDLRHIYAKAKKEGNDSTVDKVEEIAADLRLGIRNGFSNISDREYFDAKESVALALLKKKQNPDSVVDAAIREAGLFSNLAHELLEKLYYQKIDNFPLNSKKILKFFQEMAEDGLPESQRALGKIYVSGEGVKEDEEKAIKLYHAADLSYGYLELALYYRDNFKTNKFQKYVQIAALKNNSDAYYEWGVFELEKGATVGSYSLFEKAAKLDNKHIKARYQIAKMMYEGTGTERNKPKAIGLFKKIVDKTGDENLKAEINEYIKKGIN